MKIKLTPRLLYRTGTVLRWQIVRTIRKQTLAEHQYLVCMYTLFLLDVLEIEETKRHNIMLYAMHHDMSELVTGDVSTVAKAHINGAAGKDVCYSLDKLIPKVVELRNRLTPIEIKIVKLADTLDAISFLNEEGLGNHALLVKNQIIDEFHNNITKNKILFPNIDWEKAELILDNVLLGKDITL